MNGLSMGEHYDEASIFIKRKTSTTGDGKSTRHSVESELLYNETSISDINNDFVSSDARYSTFLYDQQRKNDYKSNFERVLKSKS